jgi:uncharacterized protein (DUF983 family)
MKIGFLGLLGLLFIGLRLTNQIDWSWWLVLLPVYGPFVVFVSIITISGAAGWLLRKLETQEDRKRRELREAFDNMEKALRRDR